jgi:hypothetical protein
MAGAMVYPDPEEKGRGKHSKIEHFPVHRGTLSQARAVLRTLLGRRWTPARRGGGRAPVRKSGWLVVRGLGVLSARCTGFVLSRVAGFPSWTVRCDDREQQQHCAR